jgi:hypothetical protein
MDEQDLSQFRVPVAGENARPSEVVALPPQAVPLRSQFERRLAIAAFVALWMALGRLLKLDANAYLLLGVPLTAGFQILVARRPISALWVRDAPRSRLDRTWLLTTGALAALPLYELSQSYRGGWVVTGWFLCAILGAPAAAYSIQNWNHMALMSVPVALGMLVFCPSRGPRLSSRCWWDAFTCCRAFPCPSAGGPAATCWCRRQRTPHWTGCATHLCC